jgi:hypothetical protein
MHLSFPHTCYMPAHLILLDLITRIIFGGVQVIKFVPRYAFLISFYVSLVYHGFVFSKPNYRKCAKLAIPNFVIFLTVMPPSLS